jgi:hypothetical protein
MEDWGISADHEVFTLNQVKYIKSSRTDEMSPRGGGAADGGEKDMKETCEAEDLLPKRPAAAIDIRMLAGKEPGSKFLSPPTEYLVKNVNFRVKDF